MPPSVTPHTDDAFADPHVAPAARLTSDIPGIGGLIKQRPEDFLVDEQPLYTPSGEGEHIYLLVEKRGLSTSEMVTVLARHFRVRTADIGYAGMKDKLAITRQVVSIHAPGRDASEIPDLRHDRVGILWADRHANKLRRGHLRGNRFSIKVRSVSVGSAPHALRALRRLAAVGAPNRAGEQRFGSRMNNHLVGRADLLGDAQAALDAMLGPRPGFEGAPDHEARRLYAAGDIRAALDATPPTSRAERAALRVLVSGGSPRRAMDAIDPTQRRFWFSAFQSAVFNSVLDRRIVAGALDALVNGDLAWKHDNGAVFAVTPETLAEPDMPRRLAAVAVSPSGPMWGAQMKRAAGEVDRAELAALAETGVTLEAIAAYEHRARQPLHGARRPLRVPVIDPDVEAGADESGAYIRCAFELPAGAFATVVMDEVMKTVSTTAAPPGDDEDHADGAGERGAR